MKGWRLKFDFNQDGNVVDVELVGNEAALRLGLTLAMQGITGKLTGYLFKARLPEGLAGDAMRVYSIHAGGPIAEYKGKFLTIEPVEKVAGLIFRAHTQWSD